MTTYLSRKPQTPFGAPLLDDYGQDDLSGEIFDADIALLSDEAWRIHAMLDDLLDRSRPLKREPQILVAEFDPTAPAKPGRRTLHEGWTVSISRAPDYWEDGKAWWIGEHGVVAFDAEHWTRALSITEDHSSLALRGVMPEEYGLVVIAHYDGLWATQAFANPETNHAYMLWTIAQSTLSN